MRYALALGMFALACASRPSSPAATPEGAAALPAAEVAAASEGTNPKPAGPRERPEFAAAFAAEGVKGSMAWFDTKDGVLSCSDVARCTKPAPPASTFKIANTIIALENAVVYDAETQLPWDGKPYPVADWNQDHTLRTAIRVSCLPCFQEIARKIGPERMASGVTRLGYGNRDVSGGIDQLWLTGGLRVSPVEQVDFLRRLDEGKLLISERTLEIVRDVLTLDVSPEHVLRGKTGLLSRPGAPGFTAWFVGWVELGQRRVYFATLIDDAPATLDVMPIRRRVTERVLTELAVLPADHTREPPTRQSL